jgi:transcriptional regulator with XRE-family HTH domain
MSEAFPTPVRATRLLDTLRHQDSGMAQAERALGSRLVLARNVLRLRVQRGLTQAALAEKAGMRQPRIAEIEAARANAQLDTIEQLAVALHVPVSRLLETPDVRRRACYEVRLSPGVVEDSAWDLEGAEVLISLESLAGVSQMPGLSGPVRVWEVDYGD